MFKRYDLLHFNFRLFAYMLILSVIGLFVIDSAVGGNNLYKQLFGLGISLVVFFVITFIDYNWILKLYWVIYGLNIVLLLAVKLFGKTVGGATRWIPIGTSFSLQPSEFAKVFLILFVAKILSVYKDRINTIKFLGILAGTLAVPLLLIISQPDLSTTILTILVLVTILYCSGLSYRIIGIALAVIVPLAAVFIIYIQNPNQILLEDYQRERIMAFLNPNENDDKQRQQNYSVQAIGSGQLNGKGLNNDDPTSVKNAGYIFEPQTDFIFAVVGEEMGFTGGCIIILLLALIIFECILEAIKAKDFKARLICCGLAALIAYQSFINIGVATRLLPNTGLPLPFLSYGISSLVSLYAGFGILMNIHLSNYIKLKDNELTLDFTTQQ